MARHPARDSEPDLFGAPPPESAPPTLDNPRSDAVQPATLDEARRIAAGCTRCDLYRNATRTVFGEGPADATIMLVGEQPGDQEDLQGRPFVGPAGKVLDRALAEAGIDRRTVYLTNGVKHFKNEPRGKRRLHKRPDAGEIAACRWWLDSERRIVRPRAIAALGATALRSITGRSTAIGALRGRPSRLADGAVLVVTIHPSYLLRMPDRDAAEVEFRRFVDDLGTLRGLAAGGGA